VITTRRELLALLGSTAALSWPRSARAQQSALPVVGFLGSGSRETSAPVASAFREGLKERGYVEGRNVAVDYRWAEGRYERLHAFATEMATRPVDVIFASSSASVVAAKAATTSVLDGWGRGRARVLLCSDEAG
jgi:putative ABC transport system substrate-binding protein